MSKKRKIAIWISLCIAIAVFIILNGHRDLQYVTGVVLRQDSDPGKQVPVSDVRIDLSGGLSTGEVISDPLGLFRLKLRPGVHVGDQAILRLRNPSYHSMDITEFLGDRLYVIRMVPVSPVKISGADRVAVIADIRIRYTVITETTADAGSATKTFEVKNSANVPCERSAPCSPDGAWKATIGGALLDAGEGSVFRDARVTCIAGPCPFTKIENDSFSRGGRYIKATVRNWSDTATFVLEAEVMRAVMTNAVRQSFPVIFNHVMTFTLPASAEGLSIEASLDGQSILFPLGPALKLSWATCTVNLARGGSKLYRCELKPGYQFGSGAPGIK